MKKLNVVLVVLMMFGGITMAQPGQGKGHKNVSPEMRAQKMTERMAKELSLDAAQTKQLEVANFELTKQMQANMSEQKLTKEQKMEMKQQREAIKAARKAHEVELKKILTEEQYAKYIDSKKKKDDKRR